ncbi:MAG TPA: SURF1 family protein [Xanthobacteraceae bacterium]|nr:SURF1 family protein [Xanthobacteraceae bacterium]
MRAPSEGGHSGDAPRRRSWPGLLLPALLVFCILIGLGVWQIERKAWKENLIASLTERLAAPPQALPPPKAWGQLNQAQDEYRRVEFRATFDNTHEALVFASATAFRPDVTGPGYWVFAPGRLTDGGVVMVNRGFVPDSRQNPKSRPDGQLSGPVDIVGAMRWPDARHWFTPNDDPAQNLWFARDPVAIAAAKNIGPVAPFYVEQESPVPPGGLPQPGKLVVSLPDNHLQYALTWFGLAAVLAGVFVSYALTARGPKGAGEASTPTT